MEILVHKGCHEIGGTCIQVTSGMTSILLDVGLPLSAASPHVDVSRLKVNAVLVSHSHQDHYGLIDRLAQSTPIYIGKLGKKGTPWKQLPALQSLGAVPDRRFQNYSLSR